MNTSGWLFAKVKLKDLDENPSDESVILGQLTPEGKVSMKVYTPINNEHIMNGEELSGLIKKSLTKKGKTRIGKRIAKKRKGL